MAERRTGSEAKPSSPRERTRKRIKDRLDQLVVDPALFNEKNKRTETIVIPNATGEIAASFTVYEDPESSDPITILIRIGNGPELSQYWCHFADGSVFGTYMPKPKRLYEKIWPDTHEERLAKDLDAVYE